MTYKVGIIVLFIIGLLIAGAGVYVAFTNIQKSFSYETTQGIITGFHTHKNDPEDHFPNVTFLYKGDSIFCKIDYYDASMETGGAVTVMYPPGDPESAEIKLSLWFVPLFLFFFSLLFLVPSLLTLKSKSKEGVKKETSELSANQRKNRTQVTYQPSPVKSKNDRTMSSEMIGGIVLSVIAILITWLAVYLIKNKLNNPDSTAAWGGLIALSFFALLFILLSGASWFGLFVQGKSIDIDADLIGVKSDTVIRKQSGEKVYKWKLECRWNDPRSGRQVTFQSESFEGTDLHYNRSKIKVSVYPDKADEFYVVDLSYLTTEQGPGLTLITEKMIKEADANFELVQQKNKEFEADQELRKAKTREFMVMVNRIMLVGTVLLVLFAMGVGGWFYLRYSASQNRIEEFTTTTEQQLRNRGWSFSFQSTSEPWEGLLGMLKKQVVESYPPGYCEIKGNSQNSPWTLDVLIKPTGGYYLSSLHQSLKNSSYSRLTIPASPHNNENFIAVIEVPTSFPDKIKSTLKQPWTANGKSYLNDISSPDDRQLMFNYIGVLFDRSANVFYKSTITNRSGEHYLNKLMLTISTDKNLESQLITENVKAALNKLVSTEKSGYGILISRDGIMVSTLNASLKPDEIQAMVDLGLLLKSEMEIMHRMTTRE